MWFQGFPETKVVKNRMHLDLKVSVERDVSSALRAQRVSAAVERLARTGATRCGSWTSLRGTTPVRFVP
ncbi:hypothetical protein QP089_33645 [Actinomadura sp. OS1-43]|uniref:VOC family protein n=1 Tax=Actinomadura sp. OS1-43 TaxID=604315 RepID=UPI00255AA468|nr:VOC family protein [Actinomadura sp. OS1-43]MDL4819225.1 hypothetical protein [Actinomadura sp. OS1-43]